MSRNDINPKVWDRSAQNTHPMKKFTLSSVTYSSEDHMLDRGNERNTIRDIQVFLKMEIEETKALKYIQPPLLLCLCLAFDFMKTL